MLMDEDNHPTVIRLMVGGGGGAAEGCKGVGRNKGKSNRAGK